MKPPRLKDKKMDIRSIADEMTLIRRSLHENPQTSYEETFASDLVARKLTEWGIPFQRGIAKTGLVATIAGRMNTSGKAIGFRADMDALDIHEQTNLSHASKIPGKMHACGHDGHTAMLLGAAKALKDNPDFDGTVHLIFQPAEEGGNGANKMIDEGLFKTFPMERVFAFHNWPWFAKGQIGICPGPAMASVDKFTIRIQGKGSHAAVPNESADPLVIASHIALALQTIVSRNIDPMEPAVVSITNIAAGTGAFNIIASDATLDGTVRTYNNALRPFIRKRMEEIASHTAAAYGGTAVVTYEEMNDATMNTGDEVALALSAAAEMVGGENVLSGIKPYMMGEDFGAMLAQAPGCYIFIGQGDGQSGDSPHSQGLHSPYYDFNDAIIPVGIAYWAKLAARFLPLSV